MLLVASGCRKDPATTKPPHDDAAPAREQPPTRLSFAAASMHGWRCELEISARLGKPEPDAPFDHISELALELSGSGNELALRVREMAARLVFGPVAMTLDVDPEQVVRQDPERRDVQRGDASPEARALIDSVLGAPHAFVTLDDHATVVAHRNDFGKLDAQLEDLGSVELAWIFAVPALPGDVVAGKPWRGMRTVPMWGEPTPRPIEIEIEYELDEVQSGIATIVFAGESSSTQESGSGSVEVAGSSRVRVSDGAFLGGRADVMLAFTVDQVTGGFAWRFDSTCEPPKG